MDGGRGSRCTARSGRGIEAGANLGGGEGEGLQLVEGEAHTGGHQGGEHAGGIGRLKTEAAGEIVGLLHHSDRLVAQRKVVHGAYGTGQKGHLHVGPVLQVVVVFVEIGLDKVYQTGLLVENGLEEVGRTDTVAAILFGIGVGYFLEFVHHDSMALFLSFGFGGIAALIVDSASVFLFVGSSC